ncbi:hypothetical protein D9M72_408210 [compost metagenome]
MKRVEIIGESLREGGPVQAQLELVLLQLVGCRIGEHHTFAVGEMKAEIVPVLGRIGQDLFERGEPIAIEADSVVGAEIGDEIAAVAMFEHEGIGSTGADEHVVTCASVDGLAARTTGDDIVGTVAERISVVAGDGQVLEILRQGVAHPRIDRVYAFAGGLFGPVRR